MGFTTKFVSFNLVSIIPRESVENLTLNNPKFVIRPQTQIFLTRNNFLAATDHFELLFAKIDHLCDF